MNTYTKQIASRFREVILNGTWVAYTNFKDQLDTVTYEEATHKIGTLNTIALLTFHIDYYIAGINHAFENGTLDIRDKFSFDMPKLHGEQDWIVLRNKLWADAEKYAIAIEKMPDGILQQYFVDEKYGLYQRNLDGMIEHCYYHLGQIVLILKMVRENKLYGQSNV